MVLSNKEKQGLFEKQTSKGGLNIKVTRKGEEVLTKKIGRFKGHGKVEYDIPKK